MRVLRPENMGVLRPESGRLKEPVKPIVPPRLLGNRMSVENSRTTGKAMRLPLMHMGAEEKDAA